MSSGESGSCPRWSRDDISGTKALRGTDSPTPIDEAARGGETCSSSQSRSGVRGDSRTDIRHNTERPPRTSLSGRPFDSC